MALAPQLFSDKDVVFCIFSALLEKTVESIYKKGPSYRSAVGIEELSLKRIMSNAHPLVFKGFSVYIAARLVVQCTVPGLFSCECRT